MDNQQFSDERWRPVPDYEDLYEVSDRGRVRSIGKGTGRKTGQSGKVSEYEDLRVRLPCGHPARHQRIPGRGPWVTAWCQKCVEETLARERYLRSPEGRVEVRRKQRERANMIDGGDDE